MKNEKIDTIGGQALIEGVMMRGPKNIGIAVRNADGEIITKIIELNNWIKRLGLNKVPIIRGCFILIDTMILGIKALTYSAEIAMEAEEKKDNEEDNENAEVKDSYKMSSWTIFFTIVLALGFGLLLFVGIPFGSAYLITDYFQLLPDNSVMFSICDGLIRIIVFISYLLIISRMEDVKRIFQYHGAEHKTVHAFEKGEELTYENIKKYKTLHNRCGTAFLLQVLIISIILFSFIGKAGFLYRLGLRILLLPIIAGISYEIIKLAGKYPDWKLFKILNYPGLFLQKITTKEPDEDMVEVAVTSLNLVVEESSDDSEDELNTDVIRE